MPRELTEAELAELKERLTSGNSAALKQAVQACKPARVPAARRAPTVEEKRLAGIRRYLTNLSNLHAQLMEEKRYISELRRQGDRRAEFADERARKFWIEEPSMMTSLHAQLEPFLRSLRCYFANPDDPTA